MILSGIGIIWDWSYLLPYFLSFLSQSLSFGYAREKSEFSRGNNFKKFWKTDPSIKPIFKLSKYSYLLNCFLLYHLLTFCSYQDFSSNGILQSSYGNVGYYGNYNVNINQTSHKVWVVPNSVDDYWNGAIIKWNPFKNDKYNATYETIWCQIELQIENHNVPDNFLTT